MPESVTVSGLFFKKVYLMIAESAVSPDRPIPSCDQDYLNYIKNG
jgi:hypothetical protein